MLFDVINTDLCKQTREKGLANDFVDDFSFVEVKLRVIKRMVCERSIVVIESFHFCTLIFRPLTPSGYFGTVIAKRNIVQLNGFLTRIVRHPLSGEKNRSTLPNTMHNTRAPIKR